MVSCNQKSTTNLVENAGFETLDETGKAYPWRTSRHAGELAYTFSIDNDKASSGNSSFKIVQDKKQGFGIVKQQIELTDNNANKMKFSAKLQTEEIVEGKGAQLVVNFKTLDGFIIKQVKSDSLTGTQDWGELVLNADIPERTKVLGAGIMLQSLGTVWIDDVSLTIGNE